MARCTSCNKFVSIEQQEPEVTYDQAVSDDYVFGQVRMVLSCAECGEELADAEQDFELAIDHECENPEYEILDVTAGATDRYATHDRHGKPIKRARYQKHFYGADITATVKCVGCGEEFEVADSVEEQASAFNYYG